MPERKRSSPGAHDIIAAMEFTLTKPFPCQLRILNWIGNQAMQFKVLKKRHLCKQPCMVICHKYGCECTPDTFRTYWDLNAQTTYRGNLSYIWPRSLTVCTLIGPGALLNDHLSLQNHMKKYRLWDTSSDCNLEPSLKLTLFISPSFSTEKNLCLLKCITTHEPIQKSRCTQGQLQYTMKDKNLAVISINQHCENHVGMG